MRFGEAARAYDRAAQKRGGRGHATEQKRRETKGSEEAAQDEGDAASTKVLQPPPSEG